MSDDTLRAIYNARVANSAPATRANCPSPEQLQRLAESGKGENATNLALLDHVFGCAYCRPEFALLRAVQTESIVSSIPAYTKAANRWFSAPRLAIAAVLLIAFGIGGESLRRARANTKPDVVRDVASDAKDVRLVAPVSNAAAAQFVWRKMTGTATYEIQMLDMTGNVLVTRVTSDTTYTPSTDERAKLEMAGTFDWFVAARRSDGNERRSSIARARAGVSQRR